MKLTMNENIPNIEKYPKLGIAFVCVFIFNSSFSVQAVFCNIECLRVKWNLYAHRRDFALFYFEVEIKTMN